MTLPPGTRVGPYEILAPIGAGEPLTTKNLWVKRPGTGPVPAERYEEMLGRVARRDLAADTHISMDDVV